MTTNGTEVVLARPEGVPENVLDWGRVGHLSKEEVAVFNQFRDEVEKRGGEFRKTVYSFGEEEEEPYTLTRWLRARKYKLDLVIKMVEEATECRADARKYDYHPDPKAALGVEPHIYIAQYPQFYYGNGRNGCPIYISKPGRLDIHALECLVAFPNIYKYHWHAMMHDFAGRLRANKKNIPNFTRFECNIVLDLAQLSVSQLNSRTLAIIKEQSFIDSLCFPETMSKTLVINAPRFFSATWTIIKGWLDARTVSKIEVISGRKASEKRMLELFDADQLPSDYGGTAPPSDELILKDNSSNGIKRSHTQLISFRSSTSMEFDLAAGEKVDITVYCKAKSGAKFSVSDAGGKSFAENIDVTYTGGSDVDNQPTHSVSIGKDIVGPCKLKIDAKAKARKMTSESFLLAFNVYEC